MGKESKKEKKDGNETKLSGRSVKEVKQSARTMDFMYEAPPGLREENGDASNFNAITNTDTRNEDEKKQEEEEHKPHWKKKQEKRMVKFCPLDSNRCCLLYFARTCAIAIVCMHHANNSRSNIRFLQMHQKKGHGSIPLITHLVKRWFHYLPWPRPRKQVCATTCINVVHCLTHSAIGIVVAKCDVYQVRKIWSQYGGKGLSIARYALK